MKKLTALILLIVLVLFGFYLPVMAQDVEKTVIVFTSMNDPNIPPDLDACYPENSGFVPNVVLGASLWAFQTRSKDGVMVKEKVRQIGTATACMRLTDTEALNYLEFEIGDLFIAARGACLSTYDAILEGGPMFATCGLSVLPEHSTEGIKWGQASNNSTFAPFPIPGFETGSLWTIQLIWE
jgi:hypothetical protein